MVFWRISKLAPDSVTFSGSPTSRRLPVMARPSADPAETAKSMSSSVQPMAPGMGFKRPTIPRMMDAASVHTTGSFCVSTSLNACIALTTVLAAFNMQQCRSAIDVDTTMGINMRSTTTSKKQSTFASRPCKSG
eukprot:7403432-Pyramimonas_sp.AAC.1